MAVSPHHHLVFIVSLVPVRHVLGGVPAKWSTAGTDSITSSGGELFVEYQLAAQKMRSDASVAMTAYGDYEPGYIGTDIAYTQGGYEVSERASRVKPGVEPVLMDGMRRPLL